MGINKRERAKPKHNAKPSGPTLQLTRYPKALNQFLEAAPGAIISGQIKMPTALLHIKCLS